MVYCWCIVCVQYKGCLYLADIFTGPVPDDLSQMDINDLMQYGYVELRLIIEWARKVPGQSGVEIHSIPVVRGYLIIQSDYQNIASIS